RPLPRGARRGAPRGPLSGGRDGRIEAMVSGTPSPNERRADVERTTKETSVRVAIGLDGPAGAVEVETGIPFFDHMLSQLGTHAGFALQVTARGDREGAGHPTGADVGTAVGP